MPFRMIVSNLWKTYSSEEKPIEVLKGVSLSLDQGQSLALTGESGSGKSTLLHLIAGLDHPDSGDILLAGQNMVGLGQGERAALRRKSIGLIFQSFNLIPSLTVAGNLSFQARLAGRADPDWMRDLARRLGLEDLMGRYPEELSGGQQQRVAIGRALASRPPLVLADEPTGNLDEATADAVLTLLFDLIHESRSALLMVTHSDRLADRLDARVHLSAGHIDQ